jgi:predicted dehydrogenase
MFMEEMKHFLGVASGQTPPACTLEDGIRVQQIVEGVRVSAAHGMRNRSR